MAKQTKSTKSNSDDFVSEDVISEGSAGYFKPETGDNKVRIISKPIIGWVAWDEDDDGNKSPVRTQIDDVPDKSKYDKKNQPKKFMALVVIDREDGEVKVWEITQQSVIKAIQALNANKDWGKPFAYDITIKKTGADLKTKYAVTPSPKTKLGKDDIKAANEKPVNLDALYEGENPFEVEDEVTEYFLK